MRASGPRPGGPPKKRRLNEPLTPRPCGEMTSGIGGWRRGPYHAGRTRYALRTLPVLARYENVSTRTVAAARCGVAAAGPSIVARHTTRQMPASDAALDVLVTTNASVRLPRTDSRF